MESLCILLYTSVNVHIVNNSNSMQSTVKAQKISMVNGQMPKKVVKLFWPCSHSCDYILTVGWEIFTRNCKVIELGITLCIIHVHWLLLSTCLNGCWKWFSTKPVSALCLNITCTSLIPRPQWPDNFHEFKLYADVTSCQLHELVQAVNIGMVQVILMTFLAA